ncbi:MAG: aldo/keto reductase [Balneolaceae bacterium]
MKHRIFNNTGMNTSEVGLGTWQLGGAAWGDVDDESALKILETATNHGVHFWDTADVYGKGRSERLIGTFLQENPDEIFVATKLGRFPEPGGEANFSLNSFRAHTEASLKRLGVDRIDLTQLHCIPTELLKSGEAFDWLRTLQKEGKIRHFGASVETAEEAEICLQQNDLASLQIIFNIFRRKPLRFFEEAKEKNVALIVRLPLASGLLSGKYSKQTTFPENDHRNFNRDGQQFNVGETFAGLPFELGVELAESLKAWVPEGMTMAQMALRWVLDFDAVSVVIPGARTLSQVRDNAAVSEMPPLSPELHNRLKTFYEEKVKESIRGPY